MGNQASAPDGNDEEGNERGNAEALQQQVRRDRAARAQPVPGRVGRCIVEARVRRIP